MTAAVLTISDSVSAGTRDDVSGPAVRRKLEDAGWSVVSAIVPDEVDQIALQLREWCDGGDVHAVFTSGGTGISARDVTPEATLTVIEKQLPGLAEWMRAQGMRSTPRAILSRAVAGTRGQSVIINLPGSPKGACESMESVLHLVPHIIDLLRGNTEHGNSF